MLPNTSGLPRAACAAVNSTVSATDQSSRSAGSCPRLTVRTLSDSLKNPGMLRSFGFYRITVTNAPVNSSAHAPAQGRWRTPPPGRVAAARTVRAASSQTITSSVSPLTASGADYSSALATFARGARAAGPWHGGPGGNRRGKSYLQSKLVKTCRENKCFFDRWRNPCQ